MATVRLRLVTDPALQDPATGTFYLGTGRPKIDYGLGWESIERPFRPDASDWRGRRALRLSVPLLLEGFSRGGVSVQPLFDLLDGIAWNANNKEPPSVQLSGPIPHTELLWHIADIDWSDDENDCITRGDVLIRQAAVVTFEEHHTAESAITRTRAKAKTVRSKKGDTLKKLAKRHLGNASKWKDLRKANPKLRDPNATIKTNTLIRLP